MSQITPALALRITSAFEQLSTAAKNLNTASDELAKSVGQLDAALRKLNLGVATWVRLSRSEDSQGTFSLRELGYAKVGGRWGIALRTIAGRDSSSEHENREEWLFNDAPRALRIQAIDMLPDLLEKLVRDAQLTARNITEQDSEGAASGQRHRHRDAAESGVAPMRAAAFACLLLARCFTFPRHRAPSRPQTPRNSPHEFSSAWPRSRIFPGISSKPTKAAS